MPSRVVPYPNSASDREKKLHRCIKSIIDQSYKNFELIVISDGCERTIDIVQSYQEDKRIRLLYVSKIAGFACGILRNIGLRKATGKYIAYVDSDDYIGVDHLVTIKKNINTFDWIFFKDYKHNGFDFYMDDSCDIKHTKCGTSNICHVNDKKIYWQAKSKYGYEDYVFIKTLQNKFPNYNHAKAGEYYVCHVPKKYDV